MQTRMAGQPSWLNLFDLVVVRVTAQAGRLKSTSRSSIIKLTRMNRLVHVALAAEHHHPKP